MLEIATDGLANYTAPASDWYGLVVFPTVESAGGGEFPDPRRTAQRLYSVVPGGLRQQQAVHCGDGTGQRLHVHATGAHWTAVALLPDTLDDKALGVFGSCDGDNYIAPVGRCRRGRHGGRGRRLQPRLDSVNFIRGS